LAFKILLWFQGKTPNVILSTAITKVRPPPRFFTEITNTLQVPYIEFQSNWIIKADFFAVALQAKADQGFLILEVSRSHTTLQHNR
jgi:hypothetical protein